VVAAVLGAGLIGVWVLAVNEVGELISTDRWYGTLELLMAARSRCRWSSSAGSVR
jgi:hypothetical protein